MNILVKLPMMLVLIIIKATGDCPRSCECKWKSGKESVLCINANLTEIPKQLDSGTQLLDLTGNKLQKIGSDEFFNASLLNLQKIFLSKCKLRFIDRCSFRKIINLVELDLSYNELHSVPSHTFEFISELRELRLNGNPIIRVLNNAFKMVPRLTKLDLSECRIGYVEAKAFHGLETSLEWLKLERNKISNIKPFALVNLSNLHGLELSENPWNCSCGLRALREWMLKQNIPYTIPPICKYPPRLTDKVWDKLELSEFACIPKIEAVSSQRSGIEGTNITMSCSIHGNPEPTIRWVRKNHVIANLSGTLNGGKQKLYIVHVNKGTSSLTILSADVQDNGVYVCRAENKAGKSEANIMLTVTLKPLVRIWSSKMIAAVGVVFFLFFTAASLLTYCAWTLRKRKFEFQNSVGRRENIDGYELNHKKPIVYDSEMNHTNYASPNSYKIRATSLQSNVDDDDDNKRKKNSDFSLMQTSGFGSGNEGMWNSLRSSDFEERLSESSNSRLSPDLHIPPRLKGCEPSKSSTGIRLEENSLEDSTNHNMASSASLLSPTRMLEPHFLHSDKTMENHMFYSSSCSDQGMQHLRKFPDLLVLSRNTENLINNNSFCTIPRKGNNKIKRTRHGSFGSESQSPLLPGSSGDSCDSTLSVSRMSSIDLIDPLKSNNFSNCPKNLSETPVLNFLDKSINIYDESPNNLKYRSWELEKFLEEYRTLQSQLYKMKESCENIKEDNLKF